jgi:hypothetical protein
VKRVVLLLVVLDALVGVRASMYTIIPVWTLMWWVWILATCGVSGCIGYVIREVTDHRR